MNKRIKVSPANMWEYCEKYHTFTATSKDHLEALLACLCESYKSQGTSPGQSIVYIRQEPEFCRSLGQYRMRVGFGGPNYLCKQ